MMNLIRFVPFYLHLKKALLGPKRFAKWSCLPRVLRSQNQQIPRIERVHTVCACVCVHIRVRVLWYTFAHLFLLSTTGIPISGICKPFFIAISALERNFKLRFAAVWGQATLREWRWIIWERGWAPVTSLTKKWVHLWQNHVMTSTLRAEEPHPLLELSTSLTVNRDGTWPFRGEGSATPDYSWYA